jgi:hypothetical protein
MITHERIDEQTPNGGAYSEIFYFDNNGNPSDQDIATKSVIRECTQDGELISETWSA